MTARTATPIEHGKNSSYTNRACRCDLCTEAHRLDAIEANKKKPRRERDMPPEAHGKESGYTNYACRCDRCSEAAYKARKARRDAKKAEK